MYLIILFAAALFGGCNTATVNNLKLMSDLDNNIKLSHPIKPAFKARFLTISRRPEPSYAHKQGDAIHLVCEALGAPAPSIHWFKNDAPVFEHDAESNEQLVPQLTSVARVSSTLLVTKASEHDKYTCLASAAANTVRTSTVVYSIDGSTEISERTKLYPLAPHIVVWYKVFVDTIESTVVIPCRAKGHPRPKVTWINNKGVAVKSDSRIKVLRSGSLVISSLRWSDMGEFSCRATNMFGTNTVKTFLYPAKAG